MTRRRSSPLGLELVMSVVLALVVLPLLSHGAPVQESHDLQKYSEGCYYNYNHYSEGDRILTNEPCLNCTCHNRMLMCYLRVCPFTKPIGHDCTVEKREDQCCPIVTCPEVPVDIAHHSHQLTTSSPGTELSIPEKYGCSIDNKFYAEGAQVPANPNKPCELCYCIRNRTSCLMQECTLHIDGCQPIYNKGSCCPVRYNCDHENELLEIEDFSTTTTTVRPTQGYLLPSTTSPAVTTDCFHDNEVYADGASITGKSSCEHCYCMRGDIVCAVQECEMPTLESGAKTCRALPPAAGECCPSNYVCDDDSVTTEGTLIEDMLTTILPMVQSNLHESVSQEDVQLQEHIDDKIAVTEVPEKSLEHSVQDDSKEEIAPTTISPIAGEVEQPSEEDVKDSEEEEKEDKPLLTTMSAIKEISYETKQSSTLEHSTTHKTEDVLGDGHHDKKDESTEAPVGEDIINEDMEEDVIEKLTTTVSPVVGDILKVEEEDEEKPSKIPVTSPVEETTAHSIIEEEEEKVGEDKVPSKEEDIKTDEVETTPKLPEAESDVASTTSSSKLDIELDSISSTTSISVEESEDVEKTRPTEAAPETASETSAVVTLIPPKPHIEPETSTTAQEETSSESVEFSEETPVSIVELQDKIDKHASVPSTESSTKSPIYEMITEGDDSHVGMPEIGDHKTESSLPKKKPKDEPESVETLPTASDETKDELPQIITDSTTVHSANDEEVEVTVTLKPLSPLDAVAPHAEKEVPTKGDESEENETSKPSITKDESTSDESTQGTIEDIQKPLQENDEIPAVVQEVTEVPSKPVSGDISLEEDISGETTALPVRDANIDEVTESQEKEDDVLLTESSDTDKRTTTSRPIRIHIAEEEYSTEIPSEGVEKDHVDSTTSVSSIADAVEVVTEKERGDSEVSIDHTSVAPSTVKDATTTAPTTADSELSSTEEEQVKPEKEILTQASSTPSSSEEEETFKEDIDLSTPSVTDSEEPKKESEQDVSQSTTIIPSITETETSRPEEEELKVKPQHDTDDSTTSIPSIDESVEQHEEGLKDKIQPAHGIDEVSASTPSATDSEEVSSEEEEHTKPTDQSSFYSTTQHPSIAKDKETSTEEDEIKGKPQFDSTEIPAVVDLETTNVEGDDVTLQPEVVVTDSTTSSSESKPEAPLSEKDVSATADFGDESTEEGDVNEKPDHKVDDITTVTPSISDSGSPLFEEDKIKVQPELSPTVLSVTEPEVTQKQDDKKHMEQEISDSTTIVPSIPESETEISEEEHKEKPSISEHEVPASEEDIRQQPEPSDSTTIVPSIPESETEISEGEHKEKPSISEHEVPAPEEDIRQQPESTDSTTIVPSAAGSDEATKEESEEALGAPSTASPSSDSEEVIDEEVIKKQPDQGIVDSSTKSSVAIPSETSTLGSEQDKELKPTTIIPSIADSEASIPEEEKVKEQPELNADDSTTMASSPVDADTSSQTTPATAAGDDQEIIVPTTSKPHSIDSEETSTEIDQSKQQIDADDVLRTTLSPNAYPDKESSESTDISEGTGVSSHDIIPSAIPGEGDCLANGKTFANNTTVPISNECETYCTCISSIVVCQRVQCNDPPQPNNCVLDEASTDKCCPEYICGIDSLAEDKRPTTPEDIEDEEIQFTTLAPAKKHPDISTESAISTQQPDEVVTVVHAEKPIDKDESTKTEQPEISEESTTPSSIDIELPIVTPEDPMSHIKDDKAEEESTEHSEEDFAVETSTTTKQPITTKPTKQVTGDIELPIEVTYAPEVSAPTNKPEESTTLGAADDEEEQKATATPMIQGISPAAEVVTESGKPISPKDEVSTKSPISMDVSEIDESIPTTESTLDREFTTLQAVQTETSSMAPSVIDRDDSAQSEETPETSDEGSNESGEETESDEDTKSPMLQKEEDQKLTTSRPLVSEHAGDIKPVDESTMIPEIDYQKPEIPEDLSHTKVEEKPVKPVGIVGSGESDESEEVTDKTATTTASTVLTHVEPAEEDSNKVDDIPSSESDEDTKTDDSTEHIPPHEETQISSTSSPNKLEEALDSEIATEPKRDEIAAQTSPPLTISVDESDLEKNKITTESSTPALDEEKLIVPAEDANSSEDKQDSTSAPAIDEQTIEGSGANIAEEESDDKKIYGLSSTSAPTIDRTLAPASSDESIEEKVDIPSQTIAPSADDHIVKDSGTTSSTGESDISPTSAPSIDEHLTEGSGAQISEEEDDIISHTSAPSIEKQSTVSISDEEDKIDATISPANEEHSVEGSGAPVSEDQADVHENEIISETSAPAFGYQPTVLNVEEDKSDVTVSPTVEEHPVEGSGAPISEQKYDEPKDKTEIATSTPTSKEDLVEVTVAPVIEDDSKTIAPSIANTIVPDSGTDYEEDISSQTTAPSVNVEPQPSTPYAEEDKSDEKKTEIDNQTAAPAHDFELGTEVSTDVKAHDSTSAPEVGEGIDSVTLIPVAGDKYGETELPEDKKTTVSVPTSEEEKELDATTVSTEIKDKDLAVEKTTEGSIPSKDIESSEESVDATETPSKVTPAQELEDESAGATESSATSTPVKIMDIEEDETSPTVVPIKTISQGESLDSTELPSSSTSVKPIPSFDKDLAATESPQVNLNEDNISLATDAPTISESSSVDSEPASPITMATPNLDGEILSQTQVPVSADDHAPGEELPTELPDTDVQEPHVDKTLLTTESPLPAEETIATSPGSYTEKLDNEEKLGQVPTVKPLAQTEKPIVEETSTEEKEDSASTDSTLMPEIISTHEVTPEPGKPESDDKISIEDMVTAKPSAEDVPAQTESSADQKNHSLEESYITTNTPVVFDKSETDEQPDKTVSVEKESAEDMDIKTPKPTAQTESPVPILSEEEDSSENKKPDEIKPVAQTETPSSILPEEELPSKVAKPVKTISSETEQPISLDESTKPVSADEEFITITTGKPAEDASSLESEEESDDKVSSTVAPVEKQPVTQSAGDIHADFEPTSTEKLDEEEELTEAPKDDIKVQTIAEFVTERMEDLTTVPPTKHADTDKETISEHPVSPLFEESTTTSSDEEEREKPKVPITTENVTPLTSAEESEEKTPAPEIQTEPAEKDHQPQVQTTISTEKSEEQASVIPSEVIEQSDENTQTPESSSEVTKEDTHEVQPIILPEDIEDKTQVPETLSAVAEADQKKQVQPTEGSLTQSTSDKPIEPSAGDKIDTDMSKPIESDEQPIAVDDSPLLTTINPLLPNIEEKYTTSRPEFNASIAPPVHDKIDEDLPKPMVTDDQPITEEESPLSTTIHPMFPHIEHDRTTSPPQLNATDKIDDKITQSVDHPVDSSPSSSVPTEPPTTSQSITNAPTSHYQPPGYGQVPPQYPSYAEDEYTDEDETEVFGPGTCRYGGKLFVSAQQIPRDDPCDFCFCFRSDIICLQQSCPPPISGCHEEPISGFCCPRYECPVSMATTLNITTSTTTTSTTLPPHFLHHAYRGAAAKNGCHISGKSYKVGDKIDSASGPCMHCTCGGDGQMKCDPKTCSPEPMLRQMIAVVASRRR